jgi:hypothetical protein
VTTDRVVAKGSPEISNEDRDANSEALVLGAIMGAAVVWLWGREMEEYVKERTRGVRTKAAGGVRAAEEKAGKVLDRGGDALRRAEEFLQDTNEHVSRFSGQGRKRFAQHQQPDSRVLTEVAVGGSSVNVPPWFLTEQSRMLMRVTYPVVESICH